MASGIDPKTYAAFISYRHIARDREWAMRIFEALETYRPPKSLQKQGHPPRLGRLFRDEDEIPASTDLSDQIIQALQRSSVLIVVCSPDTPKSKWVRREISLFQEMGKGDRIIPLLIAGEPEESFPPELLRRRAERILPDGTTEDYWEDVEPVAADVRPRKGESAAKTFMRAKLRLAAAALGVAYDDLYQREERRQRAIRQRVGAAIAACLLAIAGSGAWYWDSYLRVKTSYCLNYGERWGVPFCAGEVDEATARRQRRIYRLTVKAGRPRELARLNGSLTPRGDEETRYIRVGEDWIKDAARFVYSYSEGGALASVVQFSQTGRQIRRLSYAFKDRRTGLVRFEGDLGIAQHQYARGAALGRFEIDLDRRAAIGQHRLRFDGAGYLLERRFEPFGGGAHASDSQGAYGRAYRYNTRGLVESVRNLDALGDTLLEKTGVAQLRYAYDRLGRLARAGWRDKSGRLAPNENLFATVKFTRDELGRIKAADYLGVNGEPVLRKDIGAGRVTWRYDERGNQVEEAYFGVNGKAVLRRDIGAAQMNWRYDAHGNLIEQAFFGVNGESVLRNDIGAARVAWRYDERGNLIGQAYFGVNGEPVLRKDIGAARTTWRYNEHGNLIEQAYFGAGGKPVLRKDIGAARLTWRYDKHGNQIEEAYFGANGEPVLRKDWDAARLTSRYDERGHRIERAYFGVNAEPVLRKDLGVARITGRYDERGNQIEIGSFGVGGELKVKFVKSYDARDREWSRVILGPGGAVLRIGLTQLQPALSAAAQAQDYPLAKTIAVRIAGETEKLEASYGGKPGLVTAEAYGNAAWYALLARDFAKALQACERAAARAPDLLRVQDQQGPCPDVPGPRRRGPRALSEAQGRDHPELWALAGSGEEGFRRAAQGRP